jgi:hypothetical protein
MPPDTSEPPQPTSRRWQFSLLSVFILTTFVAVVAAVATGSFGYRVATACWVAFLYFAGWLVVVVIAYAAESLFLLGKRLLAEARRNKNHDSD